MKILALRGKNLASLEGDFEIDFTVEPLKSSGIFAITGNTGSGKSTILDTMCLALFNATPRVRQAPKKEKSNDDITLLGGDTRNILRRGTGEAYAEVDFMALDGQKYRSTWRVQRARKNPNGKFQEITQQLLNLTTSKEEFFSKKEFPNRITELIGLTFDQFTRAVLLAQGDFSTFLRAGEDEKAELLEKLTGTDIYTRISIEIHNKTKEAKEDYSIIQQQINPIKLLTDEEVSELTEQQKQLNEELTNEKNNLVRLDKNINWIEQKDKFASAITEAESALKKNREASEASSERYDYIAMWDTSQEIQNEYIDLQNKQKQLADSQSNLSLFEKEFESNNLKLIQSEKELLLIQNDLTTKEKEYETLKPEIEKAKTLDIQIESKKNTVNHSKAEFEREEKKKKESEKKISDFKEKLTIETLKKEKILKWFSENKSYEKIIPKTDIIIRLLNEAQNASQNQTNTEINIVQIHKQLAIVKEKLLKEEKEEEKLNQLLPVEILNLRKELTEGQPCSVCGSIHHPFKYENFFETEKELNANALEKEKEKISKSIAKIKAEISTKETELTKEETLKNNYTIQYNNAILSAEIYFPNNSDWKNRILNNSLQNELTLIAEKWNTNKQLSDTQERLIESIELNLKNEQSFLETIQLELKRKQAIYKSDQTHLQQLLENRSFILQGKNIEKVENEFTQSKNELVKKLDFTKEQKGQIRNKRAKIEGGILQIKEDLQSLEIKIKELKRKTDDWLEKPSHSISAEILQDLIAKPHDWIKAEKQFLEKLKTDGISISATLTERKQQFQNHDLSPDKPQKDDKELLFSLKQEIEKKQTKINEDLTEIQVLFSNQKKNVEILDKLRKESAEKEEIYENWQKLNYLLGSHDGSRFKRIAQGYTLDILLSYANKHLELLSKRYVLQKVPNTLALQVIDKDMLEEVRTVHSLSGGESFLISLALALGLSSLSSNRMKVESLFIDEGFGSLDIDTLTMAMEALENLQTQGRKIGVISHVAEMTERIPTQIQVIKTSNGKSGIRIMNYKL